MNRIFENNQMKTFQVQILIRTSTTSKLIQFKDSMPITILILMLGVESVAKERFSYERRGTRVLIQSFESRVFTKRLFKTRIVNGNYFGFYTKTLTDCFNTLVPFHAEREERKKS